MIEVYISKKWLFGVFGVIGALVILFLIGYGVYNIKENGDATEVVRKFIEAANKRDATELRATLLTEEMVQWAIAGKGDKVSKLTGGPWVISKEQVESELRKTKPEILPYFFTAGMAEKHKTKYVKAGILSIAGSPWYGYFILVKPDEKWEISNLTIIGKPLLEKRN